MSHAYETTESETAYEGRIISVRRDTVTMPGDTTSQRDVVVHPGAVGVIALDDEGRVVLVHQYRHPVRRQLDELPAGLLDKRDEKAHLAAARELAEEAGLGARTWHVLADILTSPGMTDEAIRIYLARDLHEVHRDVQEHEELEMTSSRIPLAEAVARVLEGELENGPACVGLLAAAEAQRRGFEGLRPADAPWRARPDAGGAQT